MYHKLVSIIQVATSFMLIGLIMIQQKGGGLSSVFGGSSTNYMKKRGIEKYLNIFTIILIAIFIVVSILIFIV